MKVNQIASVLNTLNEVMVGTEAVFADDLSNIVDAGAAVLDYTSDANGANFDNYIGKLIDQVGKVIFVDRAYTSQAPDIMKDSWEYGSILMKVRAELMDAKNNSTWQLGEIPDGAGAGYDWISGTNPKRLSLRLSKTESSLFFQAALPKSLPPRKKLLKHKTNPRVFSKLGG